VPTRRSSRRPRWQRRPDARPEEILSAALDVFGERGFAGTRCDEVARRAGVSKGTLYLYFDSKEALFREMVRAKIEGLIASAEEFVRGWEGSSADLFSALLERYWAAVNRPQHVRLSRLVMSELGSFPELARFYYQSIVLRGRRVIESVIERGMAAGEFRPVDPVLVARAVQTLSVQLAQYRSCFQQYDTVQVPAETLLRGMVDLHLHGLLSSPLTPAPEA
jgi:AcrR family transcriptional regulator